MSERERQIQHDVTQTWNLKYGTNEPTYEAETNSQTQRTDLCLSRGGGWDGLGIWGWQIQTITYRMDGQQGPSGQHRKLYPMSWDKP